MQSRILAVSVEGGRTRVLMSLGRLQGVHVGMEGYIRGPAGVLSELQVDAVEMGRCHAFVEVTPDELAKGGSVMLNPTSMPRQRIENDVRVRVIGMSVEDGQTKIILARGSANGVVAGMRGYLVGADGAEGDEITIAGVTARQAFAFVRNTPDYVSKHQNAIIRPKAPASRAAIQRRATGSTSSDDAQATAAEGVASANQRLPHLDAIQRAFGKHDISGVRAQVGGAATSAASSLGAQAYATGDKVAFASAPDLHTAAHEAAHIVQQREGVVSFQGVGAADDEHERHADQVADKVVAGESAEPLLDNVVGTAPRASVGATSDRAVQRRAAHPLDKDSTPMKAPSVGAKEIPIYEHERPHKLDGEVAVAVFLRRIYEKAHLDDGLKGDARRQKVIFAADEAAELVKELIRLTSLDQRKVNWEHLQVELVHALRAMHRVEIEAPALEKMRVGVAISDLERLVDRKVLAGAAEGLHGEDVLPAMNEKERLEMAAQAIIGACREAALFAKKSDGRVVDVKSAREHFTHMRLHYEAATDAMRGNRTGMVLRLDSDIRLATNGMTNSEQLISVAGLPWDRTFAAAFDAEAQFFATIGAQNKFVKERKYSGSIDPEKAIDQIDDIASGKSKEKWTDKKFEKPAQAVTGIGVLMDEVFVRQQTAVKNATTHIAEPRLPKEQGMLSTLLEILIKTALAGAAGAIGTKIASAARGRLERALSEKAMRSSMFSASPTAVAGDYFTSRDVLLKDAIGSGAASTTLRSEMAKDAAKELFKTAGYKAIMAAIAGKGRPSSNSSNPLHIFQEHADGVLQDARVQGRIAFVHLAPALGQAQPEPLYELYQTMLHQLPEYYSIQYNFVMEEWQNFKARMHHGVARDDSPNDKQVYEEKDASSSEDRAAGRAAPKHDKYSGSDANVGNEVRDGERGALLIDASVITDDFVGEPGSFRIGKVRLPDAEDATLRHFRGAGKRLTDVHMNKHYRLKFVMYMTEHEVNIGIGADHGFLESTLDKHELAILRVAAAGDRVTHANYLVALRGGDSTYDRFTERHLRTYLESYIRRLEQIATTRNLER